MDGLSIPVKLETMEQRVETLAELRERRAFELRLTADRALKSLDEADEFLRGRGLLTRTTDSALRGSSKTISPSTATV